MIDGVVKALKAYGGLDTTGKRLFRDELGLVRPQQAKRRRRAKVEPDGNVATRPVRVYRTTPPVAASAVGDGAGQ